MESDGLVQMAIKLGIPPEQLVHGDWRAVTVGGDTPRLESAFGILGRMAWVQRRVDCGSMSRAEAHRVAQYLADRFDGIPPRGADES